jgi:hypothetical protein
MLVGGMGIEIVSPKNKSWVVKGVATPPCFQMVSNGVKNSVALQKFSFWVFDEVGNAPTVTIGDCSVLPSPSPHSIVAPRPNFLFLPNARLDLQIIVFNREISSLAAVSPLLAPGFFARTVFFAWIHLNKDVSTLINPDILTELRDTSFFLLTL